MKNNLVSILAYAENGDNEKIIGFVNEIMEEGGIKTSAVTNSGNIVIDSLIGYWYVAAKKAGIEFSVNLNIPMEMPFRGADICLILGNLLENAVEATQRAAVSYTHLDVYKRQICFTTALITSNKKKLK